MPKILVVEDDDVLCDMLGQTLEAHGYEVSRRMDARGLVESVDALAPDLVILDVMLPGIDGLTACRELRNAGASMPMLMLSARSGDMDKIVGLESGADDYVTKPFSPR
ncbi:MAG: response regulator, partial [Gammaproteobacteria bacterium]|nr:response regulator [Gammaproteobacteria bacterium]